MMTRKNFKTNNPTTWAADLTGQAIASDGASGLIPTANSAGGAWGPVETADGGIAPMPASSGRPASGGASLPDELAAIRLPIPNVSQCEHCEREFTPRRPWGRFCSAYCRRLAWLDRNPDKAAELAERDRQRLREHIIGCSGEWREDTRREDTRRE